MRVATGTRIGPYEIVGWLGAGGMGEVYRARDARLGRDVAIKLLPPAFAADASRLNRFEQEARAAGQLNHPNILAVYDVGTHDGAPYIVSELLEGESLRRRLEGGALPPRKALDLARQTADGLAAAHDKSIVHRDVKPDNLFITNDGRVKILDFGIAKLTQPSDDASRYAGLATETADGMVVGTAPYMSPEQVRGETVDARSDIFSFGAVLSEMLTGRPAFARATAADTTAAILKEDPPEPLPATVPPALERIVSRCVEKAREARFQSARDLAFALEVLSGTTTAAAPARGVAPPRWRAAAAAVVALILLAAAIASWLMGGTSRSPVDDLLNSKPKRLTTWPGNEEGADISPDGNWVVFLSDRDGEWDIWRHRIGTADFVNLTLNFPPLTPSGFIVRKLGFSADGFWIWFNPGDNKQLLRMPLTGGEPQVFLPLGANTPAWSPDGNHIVYVYKPDRDDPVYITDRNGADASQILGPGALKRSNPIWSPDNDWIYFVSGSEPQDEIGMDVYRVRPSGGSPEQLTHQATSVNILAMLDPRTLLYVARDEDRSGPWLWALDVKRQVPQRLPLGVDQYTSVASSLDGRRVVATVANPTASLWRVPLQFDRPADDHDAKPYPTPTSFAIGPRFGETSSSLFYLSTSGTGDGVWKVVDGKPEEVWRSVDGAVSEPAAVSRDGQRVVVVVRQNGKRHLRLMSADGTGAQPLAASIEIDGAAGQGAADWSPDGKWVVTSGRDAQGPALFKIPVDDKGTPVPLIRGNWVNPVWSPDGKLIVYAGRSVVGQVELQWMTPDGASVDLPHQQVRPGGYRFLPSGNLVYLPRIQGLDFSLLDLATKNTRQLTSLGNQGILRTFDITPDGHYIVFDRSRQNSDIVLLDLTK
jgi:serine/threonine protein kinase